MTSPTEDRPPREADPARLDVRQAGSVDLDDLEAVERACFDPPWSRASLAGDLDDPGRYLLVGRSDGEIVGYASFLRVLDECELLRLAVLPCYRGRGSGLELLRRGLELCAAAGAVLCRLEVHAGNRSASNLYIGLGFETVGRRRAYYADGGDALLMVKDPLNA